MDGKSSPFFEWALLFVTLCLAPVFFAYLAVCFVAADFYSLNIMHWHGMARSLCLIWWFFVFCVCSSCIADEIRVAPND